MKQDMIVIPDLGNSGNTRPVRGIRGMGVYNEIYPHDITTEKLKMLPNVKSITIGGDPNNIVGGVATDVLPEIYRADYPVMATDHRPAACKRFIGNWDKNGDQMFRSFVSDTYDTQPDWNMKNFISDQVELIRQQMGDRKVLLALSGGVDSSIVAVLLIRAIGKQLIYVHVNHGLTRKGESESMIEVLKDQTEVNLVCVNTTECFLEKLDGIVDPEQKRKVIGAEFIHMFEEEAGELKGIDSPAQRTIYPDIMESGTKTAKVIKFHHNVDDLPEDLDSTLIEPPRQLFKDGARVCGLELGLPYIMVYRQSFPGPGLSVHCLGTIMGERPEVVKESGAILREEFADVSLDKKVWQYFTIAPDFKSMDVRGSVHCSDYPVIIWAVDTVDAMTASIERVDYEVLQKITDRILNGAKNVSRVCYDLDPKPTATVERE